MTIRNDVTNQFRSGEAERRRVVPPIEPFPAPRLKSHPDLPEWKKPVSVKRPFWLANPVNQLTTILWLLAAIAVLVVVFIILFL